MMEASQIVVFARHQFHLNTICIDTQVFKTHSLRGATATHLLVKGVATDLVQARGQWASNMTMDLYYSGLHQHQDW